MFLLNSRISLVIKPWYRTYTNTKSGTPYTEGTGLVCRIPLYELVPHTLGYSPRGTCAGSGYECLRSIFVLFSWTQGINQIPHKRYHSRL